MIRELENTFRVHYDSHAFGPFCLRVPSRHSTAVYTDTGYHPLPNLYGPENHRTHLLPSECNLHLDLTINLEIM